MASGILEPTSIPEDETEAAAVAARELGSLLRDDDAPAELHIDNESVRIPGQALRLFVGILGHLANGEGVIVLPKLAELSTQQAADMLNVSRPFLVDLIKNDELPARKVGTHRRVLLSDLLAYKRRDDSQREMVLKKLAEETEALGLYE